MKSNCILLITLSLLIGGMTIQAKAQTASASVQCFLNEQERLAQQLSIQGNTITQEYDTPRLIGDAPMIEAFITATDDALQVMQSMGVVINNRFKGFVVAQIPMNELQSICTLPGVTDLAISHKLSLATDSTLSLTHVNEVHQGGNAACHLPKSYKGQGVIVGIIDSGFDYWHRTFRESGDTTQTRIRRVYTLNDGGLPALGTNGTTLPGSVYMGDAIRGLTSDNKGTHGTHTASIAAGSLVPPYGGMAPEADIVLCAAPDGLTSTFIANAMSYICSYADSVGLPCVMSVSISTTYGSHDGADYVSAAAEQLTGRGKIFVISAGNNAGKDLYASHDAATAESPLRLLMLQHNSNDADWTGSYYSTARVDSWMRSSKTRPAYKYHIIDLTNHHIVWESKQYQSSKSISYTEFSDYYEPDTTVSEKGYMQTYVNYSSLNKKYQTITQLYNLHCKSTYTDSNGKTHSRYAIGLSVYPYNVTTCGIDAWISSSTENRLGYMDSVAIADSMQTIKGARMSDSDDGSAIHWVTNYYAIPSDKCSIGTLAVSDSTISAGSYISKNTYTSYYSGNTVYQSAYSPLGDIADYSSYVEEGYGPLGKPLPTVTAPGAWVAAAISSYWPNGTYSPTIVKVDSDGSRWGMMSGTSMAAPTVAGIIALWLQVDSTLTPSRVKEVIKATAIHDQFTEGNPHFGVNGKIDALAGINYILKQTGSLLGDVNQDGLVDIMDLTALIAYILGNEQETTFNVDLADINGDGTIDVEDATALVQLIINKSN